MESYPSPVMPTISLSLGEHSYNVHVENEILQQSGDLISQCGVKGNIALITNTTLYTETDYAAIVLDSLREAGYNTTLITIPDGESTKSLKQVEDICDRLTKAGIDRQGTLIALGGGVIGDLVGFVASIHYRGIPFIQIPTTIVSQVDSSVGGKTAVNLPSGKNLVGAFHHPRLVIADPLTLSSLPPRIFTEGFAEIVKHAIIQDVDMLDLLEKLAPELKQGFTPKVRELLPELIARNVAIKARIVEKDEKETLGLRALLNFGHTIGHGIEAALPYGEVLHGEGVSLGSRAALYLSEKHAGLPAQDARRVLSLMRELGLPLTMPPGIRQETVLEKLMTDKKFESGQIRFVLASKLGNAYVDKSITIDNIREAISDLYKNTD